MYFFFRSIEAQKLNQVKVPTYCYQHLSNLIHLYYEILCSEFMTRYDQYKYLDYGETNSVVNSYYFSICFTILRCILYTFAGHLLTTS